MIFIHIQTGREEVPTGQKILRRVQNILYTKLYIRTKNIYLPARTYTTVSRVNSLYYNIILLYSKSLRFFFFFVGRSISGVSENDRDCRGRGGVEGTGPPAADVRSRAVGINAYRRAPRARTPRTALRSRVAAHSLQYGCRVVGRCAFYHRLIFALLFIRKER